ncbi:MAG: GatB/YqeY domain-containing protein [Melioribacteraceae bacterium]|nr:GatB/YqeY domain-containing protein [Melioribacteraceae bacterium]
MTLKEKISNDLKEAMKSGDKTRLATVRSIRALILEFEKSGSDSEMNPDDEINLLTSAAKKRKDSIEQYEKAGRIDLADQEKAELEILTAYLPAQMDPDELYSEVKKLAEELGVSNKSDFKILMPKAIQKFKGKADGKLVKEIVEKVLE